MKHWVPCLSVSLAACLILTLPCAGAAEKGGRGGTFEVYANSRGAYVQGKSVACQDLPGLVRRSKAAAATLCAERDLPRERVDELIQFVRRGGVRDVAVTRPKSEHEQTVERFQAIFERQEADHVAVYLNSRGIYINGKSVKPHELSIVLRYLGKDQVVITASAEVARDRVVGLKREIEADAVPKIKVRVARR